MARNEWSRWGRGACEGYNLEVGDCYARFHASVVRSVYNHDIGGYTWSSAINGHDHREHPTREAAMARVEFELSLDGEKFVREYAGYKVGRVKNKFSVAVDEARKTSRSNSVSGDGAT